MNRRGWIGVAVLAVALVAAVGGNARTKTVGGAPEVGPIPGPPTLGTCVIRPVSTSNSYDAETGIITYPVPVFGNCTRHFGEVAAVLPGALGYLLDPDHPDDDPNRPSARCMAATNSYLGLAPTQPAALSHWRPTLRFAVVAGAPTASEQALGQDWVACIAIPGDGYQTYDRTMRDAMRTGAYPLPLATCTNITTSNQERSTVDCQTPHNSEEFATLFTAYPDPDPAGRPAQCIALVNRMSGMPDPTAGGRLRIDVDSQRLGAPDPPSNTGEQQILTCQIVTVGSTRLHGPLLGLGDNAVPLR